MDERSVILDPACGAGDLLLACAAHMSIATDLRSTLDVWQRRLVGLDIHEEFVLAARLRLALAALSRGAQAVPCSPSDLLARVRVASGLDASEEIGQATHVVMNPPFTRVAAPHDCAWGSGTVNSAGLFLEACVKAGRPGLRILAILPDVLRSGSRYEKWRRMITGYTSIRDVKLLGQFERWADVDVFLLDLEVASPRRVSLRTSWDASGPAAAKRVSDYFSVGVGPVVDYRDPRRGPWRPFMTARDAAAWAEQTGFPCNRRYGGRVIQPPFVVVRRTSRCGDRSRAVATLVRGSKPVAVENHLLVLRPKDRTVARCTEALKVLRSAATSRWLDQRIRCRHLTVGALANVPWRRR
jgi:hypothetical protein